MRFCITHRNHPRIDVVEYNDRDQQLLKDSWMDRFDSIPPAGCRKMSHVNVLTIYLFRCHFALKTLYFT